MSDQPQTQLFPATVPCAFCQQNAVVVHVLRRDKIHVFVYECDCGSVTVLGRSPSIGMANLQIGDGNQSVPMLVFSAAPQKVATPASYIREIKNGGKS